MTSSLATRSWIDTTAGQLSLAEALEKAPHLRLTTTDPLEEYCLLRLMRMVCTAVTPDHPGSHGYAHNLRHAPQLTLWSRAANWVLEHEQEFDLFGDQPFWQDGSVADVIRDDNARVNPLYLDTTAAWLRPLFFDHRHPYTRTVLSFSRAAHLLLLQQLWPLPGRISAKDAHYGKGCNFGKLAVHASGAVFVPQGTSLAGVLAAMTLPVPESPLDDVNWTYRTRADDNQPLGPLDALSWHNRRVFLEPNTSGDGVRWVGFAQGWLPVSAPAREHVEEGGPKKEPLWSVPGFEDVVCAAKLGIASSATYLTRTEEDTCNAVAAWWNSGPDSLPGRLRDVWGESGLIGVRVVGRAIDQKLIHHTVDSLLPMAALTDERSGAASQDLASWRGRRNFPGSGCEMLQQEEFLAFKKKDRHLTLDAWAEGFSSLVPICDEGVERDPVG